MLTIRFARTGRKNRAQFKIMLQEHTVAPGGRHIEILGSYDPHLKKAVLKGDKIKHWISKGAQTSDSVHNLLVSQGLIEGEKRKVKIPKKAEEAVSEEEAKGDEKAGSGDATEKPKEEKKEEEPK